MSLYSEWQGICDQRCEKVLEGILRGGNRKL